MKTMERLKSRSLIWLAVVIITTAPLTLLAQGTRIVAPKNNFSPGDDVKLGREAASEIEHKLSLFPENSETDNYIESIGRRLVVAIPSQYQHPQFNYQFDVVNAREINAFALPGGPMYVNRGIIEAARNEGEVAGVMAHEIAHVALRHGTAQATMAQSPSVQLGAIGGAILGAIIGGDAGAAIARGTQISLGAYLLKYSRAYETQADILGAQIMSRADYDPRDLANMFRTIERQSGGGGPQWLSSHPNPGNRYRRIMEEAERLQGGSGRAARNTGELSAIKSGLRGVSSAPANEKTARGDLRRYPGGAEQRVAYPSDNYRTYRAGDLFRVSVPNNWREFPDRASVTFAPEGAYGNHRGQSVFTHGAVVGVVDAGTRDLRDASERYINALLQNNQYLSHQSRFSQGGINGRPALMATLSGRSPVTGRVEVVRVYTTLLSSGELFYLIGVAPRDQVSQYDRAFQDMLSSVRLAGR
ncbi:MAG: M48 family metalloprotease [Blastocatellales bacterium]